MFQGSCISDHADLPMQAYFDSGASQDQEMSLPDRPEHFGGVMNVDLNITSSVEDSRTTDWATPMSPSSIPSLVDETMMDSPASSTEFIQSTESSNDYIPLGTVALRYRFDATSQPQLVMWTPNKSERYPSPWLTSAVRKGWVHLDEVADPREDVYSYLKVSVLPEDVGRGRRDALKDFRKFVKFLLNYVNRSAEVWYGTASILTTFSLYEIPVSAQEESLFYIFNTLRSPSPNLECFRTSAYGYEAVRSVLNDSIAGLTTELYPYQRRSVATMIQREEEPAKILDPRKPIYKDIHDSPFYLDIHEGALVKNAPLYTEPQGGILAETMGYGKTLICIALILATRGHYPKVPEDVVDQSPLQPPEKVGSLLSMAARKVKHEGISWKAEFHALKKAGYQFDRCLNELARSERDYAEPIFTSATPHRKGKQDKVKHVRICSATLVIVPPNLLIQWEHEIRKHTESAALDLLIVDSPTKDIPSVIELTRCDVMLITKARFEQEYRDDDLHQGKIRQGEAKYSSPLTAVRWLRVICDEGHGFAGSSSRTNAMAMLDKMYIERRWVVSGTPSSTLHSVDIGLSTTALSTGQNVQPSSLSQPVTDRQTSLITALQRRRAPTAHDSEAKDSDRLRLMVVNFLQLQPWANHRGTADAADWKKYLSPSADVNGIRHTPLALREVLQTLIVRHRIEDIDTDLMLPPLHNTTVYLEPFYHDKLSINMFFLVLASNYITSEREDEDYMFHPRNRKKLDLLINNLRQASFHWVGFSERDIRETLRVSDEYLDKNLDNISDEDGVLLTEAIMNGERALSDPSWKAFATLHEIGVYIRDFPQHASESWALDGRGDGPILLGTVQAREAQKYLKERMTKTPEDVLSGLAGAGVRVMNAARSRAEDEQEAQQKAKAKAKSNDNEKQQLGASEEPRLKTSPSSMARKPSSVISKKRRRSSHGMTHTLLTPPASPVSLLEKTSISTASQDLSNVHVASFTSSKLTYLTSRLLNLPPSTKSLVFYQHNNTAFFIAEALELLSIPFRIYANTLSVAQRNAYLADFNSPTSEIRVMLMDLKQASHGLHVACASYVCIVSPIWDASVESQAIKRAHRIGQTKEVIVETLVLQGTFEEEMVKRRKWKDENLDVDHNTSIDEDMGGMEETNEFIISSSMHQKVKMRNANQGKSLLDDRHMVSVIKDIKFMKFSKEEKELGGTVREMNTPKQKRLLINTVHTDDHYEVVPVTKVDKVCEMSTDIAFGKQDLSFQIKKRQKVPNRSVNITL